MSSPSEVRVGTRRSALARTQSQWVATALATLMDRPVRLVGITTEGDVRSGPLTSIGGTGVFVSALREALLGGAVDLAVHSLKDLPTAPATGLTLAAVPRREDPRDVLVTADGRTLQALPPGARVGTGSPRRRAQLLHARADLDVRGVRGNVDSRLRLVAEGRLDAVVLAWAGLSRLDLLGHPHAVLGREVMLPAPGQGALAVEARATLGDEDPGLGAALAELEDAVTRRCVTAERSLLATLSAGCTAPVGALAVPSGTVVSLTAGVFGADRAVLATQDGDPGHPEGLGADVASLLLDEGASDLIANTL